jgi:hypothetical protein
VNPQVKDMTGVSDSHRPSDGFSESSGIPHVWNIWIIYPWIAWLFFSVARGISVYMRQPISEKQIQREMERQR